MRTERAEVVIVGAGPAGSVAAGLLRKQGIGVLVLEKETFPRFSIGESLLPQSMAYIEEAGMLQAVVEAGFQYKNGAAFARGDKYTDFDFREKFSAGWGTTYQVQRAHFDDVLIREAQKQGAEVRFRHVVEAVDVDGSAPVVTVRADDGTRYQVEAKFLLDASGFGRILPRLLDLETPSNFPVRAAIFTHVADGIPPGTFDRNKIRVGVHPEHDDVWYWTIPFSNGRCSLGVVAEKAFLDRYEGDEMTRLRALVDEDPNLATLLKDVQWDTPARQIAGYAANVRSLWGNGYALLGNAGEFLDPVFSSGVTIAFKSASLATACLARLLAGEPVDWEAEFARPLKAGVDCFRVFVEAWYEGRFQRVIFHEDAPPEIRAMISSILAGYAWDTSNPFVADARRRLGVVEQLCNA
ncbi:NAD(P)/FAD-dependent oxidoreductase [Cupriavidus pauculus]|uniref:NAD(P)/FAD-dependent oxidoreductase n=1 Tax=Cupriavidus pauculus TaxID=82633 RepID=UPI001EE39149|nr:NAD(P)/FAD-dependent oxidoreductase [Cupriavidus pauculus]GJG95372.1 NAD(P)/FAD-dependent oxidoreductase [Cupriavidus pauculus]